MWIYLDSQGLTSSLALAESDKPLVPGSEPSPIVSENDIPKPFCFRAWSEGKLIERQSGTTCLHCGEICSRELTSSLAGSPARISAQRGREPVLEKGHAAGSIPKSSVLLANFDPATSSWKMFQQLLFGGGSELLETLPRRGMTVAGSLYQLPIAEPPTDAKGGGVWHTPRAQENGENSETFVKRNGDRSVDCFSGLSAQAQALWRTPDTESGGTPKDQNGLRASGNHKTLRLSDQAKQAWATPNARDFKGAPGPGYVGQKSLPRDANAFQAHQDPKISPDGKPTLKVTPRLNPRFVEALLGYNPGATELSHSAIAWIGSRRGKRSKS